MIRVALVAHLSEVSGAGTALLEKAVGLDPARFHALLVLPGHGPLKEKALQAKADVHVVPNVEQSFAGRSALGRFSMLAGRVGYLLRLARFFRREKVDVVLVNSTASIFAGVAAWLARRPVVWQVHEVIEHPSRLTRIKLGLIERLSRAVLYDAVAGQKAFPARRVARRLVVRNHIDPVRYARAGGDLEETGRSLGAAPGEPLVTTNGAFRRKAPDIFLLAAGIVARTVKLPVRFAVLGAPAAGEELFYDSLLELVKSQQLDGRVCFAGARSDVPQILKRTAVFVSPSRNEAMPIILTEAMAAGTSVIASDVGDCRLFLEEGKLGKVVPVEDPQALAGAICELLDNPAQAQETARLAQERIGELYEARSFWRPLEALLAEVAGL